MKDVIHLGCGGLIYRVADHVTTSSPVIASDVYRPDGTQPEPGSLVDESCPDCGDDIVCFSQLVLVE